MRHIKKLWVRIVAAAVVGLLIAYLGVGITHVTRPCAPTDLPEGGAVPHCAVIEKVFIHPRDLLANKQGRLMHFSETFVIASLAGFALLSVFVLVQKKK